MSFKRSADTLCSEKPKKMTRLTHKETSSNLFDDNEPIMNQLNNLANFLEKQVVADRLQDQRILRIAVDNGRYTIAATLVRSGVDLNECQYSDGGTILHKVLKSYEFENNIEKETFVKLLLDHGANVNAVDDNGHSVLQDAIRCENCSTQIVELLLDRGAKVTVNKDDEFNDLFLATIYKPELLPKLVVHQVPNEETRNMRGAMAIHYLILKKPYLLYTSWQNIKNILALGVPVNSFDPCQRKVGSRRSTLLGTAIIYKNQYAFKLLLKCGADPHKKNQFGHTPLYHATVIAGYTDVSRLLIAKGASLYARNDDGGYPIHGACKHASLRNIHLFLNLGADLNCTNNYGHTPFQCIKMNKTSEEACFLIIKHLALMIAKGEKVSDQDITKIYQHDRCNNHFKNCEKELEQMKEEIVYGDVSYFSLFSRNMKSMVLLMKNQNFIKKFKQTVEKQAHLFPIYFYMLLHTFEIAEIRLKMLMSEKDQLQNCFGVFIPDHIIENIAYYFSYEKLQYCQDDYYMSLHKTLKNTKNDKAIVR